MAPVTRRRQAQMEANSSAAEEPTPAPKSAASKRGQKLALRGKEGDEGKTPSKTVAKKSTVIVFDDDEMSKPVVIQETVAKPAPPVEDEDDEASSDDEAPEAVSTSKAASEIKSAAKATQRAAQEQATTQKRKRQERDALLKKQAEERKKMEEEARSSPASDGESKSLVAARQPTAARKRGGQVDVPDLLPAEFLTDSSGESDSEADDDATGRRSKPKRRKVAAVERSLTRLDKGPRDATIDSTVYQVAKKTDGRMAPKVKQYSKSTKELLLKRQRMPTKPRGGFLARR